jgi:hypothetical protein
MPRRFIFKQVKRNRSDLPQRGEFLHQARHWLDLALVGMDSGVIDGDIPHQLA